MDNDSDMARRAKLALERICSGAEQDASRYYSPAFVDHVNDVLFRGLAGAQRSVALYKKVLDDLAVSVEEQIVEGNRITSRFVVTGSSHGRPVRFNGITISRFEKDLIVEDWSVTDTLCMLRQLGVWRAVLVAARAWRDLPT
jgi:hypothetical protein